MEKIVVGTDGSASAAVALRWAAEEAELHGAALEAVLAWSYLDQHHPDGSDAFDPSYSAERAAAALRSFLAGAIPDAKVEERVVCDLAAPALLEAGDEADLLVLGARGRGGFPDLLLGSVAERVVHLATRPTVVVRAAAPVRGGRVVVGVDGSARSRHALRWAAAEARARGAALDVVHAWRLPLSAGSPAVSALPDLGSIEDLGRGVLDDALLDPALEGVDVHGILTTDTAGHALVGRAAGAGLVVVGGRGLGRVAGALLGSVSRQLLHHAPCPVVVI